MMLDLYFAYFYKPSSLSVDGWRDRFCCKCDKDGSLGPRDYKFVEDNKFVYIGHYKHGSEPLGVWDKAKTM